MNECKHILGNDKQGMYTCKKCGKSLEKEIQDEKELQEIIDKNIKLFNDLRGRAK